MSDETKKPAGRVFTGTVGQLSDSPWLAATDLLGLPAPVVEIEAVMLYPSVVFAGGRKKPNVPTLKFKGRGKEMCLTAAVNRKFMAKLFGADTSKWIGQRVQLWIDPNVRMPDGGTGPAIRLREAPANSVPAAAPAASEGEQQQSS